MDRGRRLQAFYGGRCLLLGHRGVRGPGRPPENTIAAFRQALDAGLDGFEFDVQMGADGSLVCHHDFDLDGRPIERLKVADFRAARSGEAAIPTLQDALALVLDLPEARLNLEIKSRRLISDGRERMIAAVLSFMGLRDRVIVSTFNPASLIAMKEADPEVLVALLTAPQVPWWIRTWGSRLRTDALHPASSLVSGEFLKRNARGRFVGVWTVNQPDEAKRLANLGVHAIIGDDPSALLAVRSGGN